MALSAPRSIFGVHSFAPYNRSTGEFYGILKVLGGSSLALSGETVDLMGGSSKWPWAVEDSTITAELNLRFSQYEDFLFELFLGKQPTANSAQSSGDVSTPSNVNGSSVVESTTGIASIAATSGSESDLKFGKYIIKAASTTEVDIYISSDVDQNRGTDGELQNDLLKITASPLTVPGTGGTVDVPSYGLTITGGSGTVAFTAGDTAEVFVQPINDGSMDVTIGGSSDTFPEFGAVLYAQKRANGEMLEIDCYRCKAIGLPINFEMNAWSESEVTAKVFYDSAKNAVFKVRHVQPSSVN